MKYTNKLSILIFFSLGLLALPPLSAASQNANRVHKEFYDNGNPRLFLRFKDDLIVRKKVYYRNGHLKLDYVYKDGLAQKMRNFYETGELFSIWTKKTNETKYFYRNGQVRAVVKADAPDPEQTSF